MKTKGITLTGMMVAVAGGLLATSAVAQTQMASASAGPQRDVLVFADKGGQLSDTAAATVRSVATEAKSAPVTLVGRPENVASVKAELQRHGVPAQSIMVKSEANTMQRTPDGLSNPADRKVEIKF